MLQDQKIEIYMPSQLAEFSQRYVPSYSDRDKMQFVIDASRASLEWQLGGPFAAAVFRRDNHELIALGVNLIINQQLSILHAEVVAIMQAQRALGCYDLAVDSSVEYELFTSTEPCTMCLGACHWSGLKRIVSAATDADASDVGFDEGPKPSDWAQSLRERGHIVDTHLLRSQAIDVLKAYQQNGGTIYNSLCNS